ncbi:MAG: hypothetical protein LUD29_04590 [Clostridia bacterium]|nr:hypothetical protein [Clostridia bacterium]
MGENDTEKPADEVAKKGTKRKEPNRSKSVSYHIRVTPKDANEINAMVKKSGVTLTQFFLNCMREKTVVVFDGEQKPAAPEEIETEPPKQKQTEKEIVLRKILKELEKEGNNLNQAMIHVYTNPSPELDELLEAIRRNNRAYNVIIGLLNGGFTDDIQN